MGKKSAPSAVNLCGLLRSYGQKAARVALAIGYVFVALLD